MEDIARIRKEIIQKLEELQQRIVALDRTEAERESTREALRMYERIVSVSEDRLAFIDSSYTYLAANESYLKAHNLPRERVIGRTVADVFGTETFFRKTKGYLDACLEGKHVRYQTWLDLPGLGVRYLDVMYFPFFEADGKVTGLVVSSRDITERKREEDLHIEEAASLARAEELKRSRRRIVNAQESLRKEIAHQLHGAVQNRLIVILHRLTHLETSLEQKEVVAEIQDIREKLRDILDDDIRSISHRLYPSILRRGLVPALQSLADQFEPVIRIDLNLDTTLVEQEKLNNKLIPELARLSAYRIVEEALTNVVKHAGASTVKIKLTRFQEYAVSVVIEDDGHGFDKEENTDGIGMSTMNDYAEVAGGTCLIESMPDHGTAVIATIPLNGQVHDEAQPEKDRLSG